MEVQPLKRLFSSTVCQSCRLKLLRPSRRAFTAAKALLADNDDTSNPTTSNVPKSPASGQSLFQRTSDAQAQQQQERSNVSADLLGSFGSQYTGGAPSRASSAPGSSAIEAMMAAADRVSGVAPTLTGVRAAPEPFVLHVTSHKHNTHLALTGPFPPKTQLRGPHDRRRSMSMSTGNLGFRKSARGKYDAAHQLAAFVMGAINEREILPLINDRGLELRFRGFGKGREAVTKALLGSEGRMIRNKVVRVSDVTPVKFGGTRSPKPRRLG